ncbi:MAG: hypothetical protein OXG04_22755 [Acidobacteria bacterium]|nr:hypothetical protein [Acidobacteriota bacterium]
MRPKIKRGEVIAAALHTLGQGTGAPTVHKDVVWPRGHLVEHPVLGDKLAARKTLDAYDRPKHEPSPDACPSR